MLVRLCKYTHTFNVLLIISKPNNFLALICQFENWKFEAQSSAIRETWNWLLAAGAPSAFSLLLIVVKQMSVVEAMYRSFYHRRALQTDRRKSWLQISVLYDGRECWRCSIGLVATMGNIILLLPVIYTLQSCHRSRFHLGKLLWG